MTHEEIVMKLIGPIRPVGESNEDEKRFENLKQLCELVDNLVYQISEMAYDNKGDRQASVKRAVDYAQSFMKNQLGIVD